MKKKIVCKIAVLLLIVAAAFYGLTNILIMKWKYPCYESIVPKEFYELDKDAIEVCFLGSSQVVYGISGMELYGDYGISSYSLGTALQPLECSYIWLQECKERQKNLKLVVLDTSMLYEISDEARYHQAYDNMKWSLKKFKAVYDHCKNSETADPFLSYMFTLIKYHGRWQEIGKDDFTINVMDDPMFRGNVAYGLRSIVNPDRVAYDNDAYNPELEMYDFQKESFEKIVNYCQENDLELLLIKTPKSNWSITKHEQTEKYAEELGLPYLDFSSYEWLEKLELDTNLDFRDADHLNIVGSAKLSKWLGEYLKDNYELTDYRTIEGYDDLRYERYCQRYEDSDIQLCFDPVKYFEYLDHERYEVLIGLTSSYDKVMTPELEEAMKKAGITVNWDEMAGHRYAAYMKQGKIIEEADSTDEDISYGGKFSDSTGFRVLCKFAYDEGSTPYMRVDYQTHEFSHTGINVLVFDRENHCVVDKSSIYYDVYEDALTLAKDNTFE